MDKNVSRKIEKFFAQYKTRRYSKGQVLLLNGDKVDYVYHLLSGIVKQYDVSYRGDEIILNLFKPPAFFPMSVAINRVTNPYIYEAETDVEICQAPANEVVKFIKSNPDVMFDLLSRVFTGVDGLIGRMAQLMASNANHRVVYELILESSRFGTIHDDGSCDLNISEKDLGARAGLSRETVSREINKLKSDKLLTTQKKNIVILDLKGLEKKLNLGA